MLVRSFHFFFLFLVANFRYEREHTKLNNQLMESTISVQKKTSFSVARSEMFLETDRSYDYD